MKPWAERTRKEKVLCHVETLSAKFLYYDRKEDDDLPPGAIEKMVASGEVTIDEIVAEFRKHLEVSCKP